MLEGHDIIKTIQVDLSELKSITFYQLMLIKPLNNKCKGWLSGSKRLPILLIDVLFFTQGILLLLSTPTEAKIISLSFILPIILGFINPIRFRIIKLLLLACGILLFVALSVMLFLLFHHQVFLLLSIIDILLFVSSCLLTKRYIRSIGSSGDSASQPDYDG